MLFFVTYVTTVIVKIAYGVVFESELLCVIKQQFYVTCISESMTVVVTFILFEEIRDKNHTKNINAKRWMYVCNYACRKYPNNLD